MARTIDRDLSRCDFSNAKHAMIGHSQSTLIIFTSTIVCFVYELIGVCKFGLGMQCLMFIL
jgi:hypothetical protein